MSESMRGIISECPGDFIGIGTGWHVIVRYREGHERRIEGFASKAEAVDWIEANLTQVDK
jgi:hypothetical protein